MGTALALRGLDHPRRRRPHHQLRRAQLPRHRGSVRPQRFRPGRINEQRLAAYREHTPEQLIEILRSHLRPHGLTAGFAGGIGLSDCLIHHQDIRRPLGLPREVPHERLLEALQIALKAPVIPAKSNATGLRLVATDLDWQHGDGEEVAGPAEALLLTLAGRTDALDELEGPGQPKLRERVAAAG